MPAAEAQHHILECRGWTLIAQVWNGYVYTAELTSCAAEALTDDVGGAWRGMNSHTPFATEQPALLFETMLVCCQLYLHF